MRQGTSESGRKSRSDPTSPMIAPSCSSAPTPAKTSPNRSFLENTSLGLSSSVVRFSTYTILFSNVDRRSRLQQISVCNNNVEDSGHREHTTNSKRQAIASDVSKGNFPTRFRV
eukprot:1190984-Prorocentrum_minimum.AAC.1